MGVASRGSQQECPPSWNPAVIGTEGGDPVGTMTHSPAALGQQYDPTVSDNLHERPHSASCPSLTWCKKNVAIRSLLPYVMQNVSMAQANLELWREWNSGTCSPSWAKIKQYKSITSDTCHSGYEPNDSDIVPASKATCVVGESLDPPDVHYW